MTPGLRAELLRCRPLDRSARVLRRKNGEDVTKKWIQWRMRKVEEAAGWAESRHAAKGRVHVLRHTAAKLRRDAGETVEAVSAFLDHSSLSVTTTYLRRLDGEADAGWEPVAEAIGA